MFYPVLLSAEYMPFQRASPAAKIPEGLGTDSGRRPTSQEQIGKKGKVLAKVKG